MDFKLFLEFLPFAQSHGCGWWGSTRLCHRGTGSISPRSFVIRGPLQDLVVSAFACGTSHQVNTGRFGLEWQDWDLTHLSFYKSSLAQLHEPTLRENQSSFSCLVLITAGDRTIILRSMPQDILLQILQIGGALTGWFKITPYPVYQMWVLKKKHVGTRHHTIILCSMPQGIWVLQMGGALMGWKSLWVHMLSTEHVCAKEWPKW
jgi:hypothetical protein